MERDWWAGSPAGGGTTGRGSGVKYIPWDSEHVMGGPFRVQGGIVNIPDSPGGPPGPREYTIFIP